MRRADRVPASAREQVFHPFADGDAGQVGEATLPPLVPLRKRHGAIQLQIFAQSTPAG